MNVGQTIILNKRFFSDNAFFVQYFPNLKPSIPYEVTKVDFGGAVELTNPETNEVFNMREIRELDGYFCFVVDGDSFRTV